MKLQILPIVVAVTWAAPGYGQTIGAPPSGSSQQTFVKEYCIGCHNDRLKRGNLVLPALDVTSPASDAAIWEKVIRKVRAGMMPPVGARQPGASRAEAFASGLEAALDKDESPHPGRPALHRLNRTEYANSVRDLLGVEIDVDSMLPPDDRTHGFDNIAAGLTLSPTLMESYINAAGVIARLAVGDQAVSSRVEPYRVPQAFSQRDHVEGTPLGTRGGIAVRHFFPADGEYTFGMSFYNYNGRFFGALQDGEQLEISIDGARVALLDVDLSMAIEDELRTPPILVKAGPRVVAAAFVTKARGPVSDFIMPFETALSNLASEVPGVTALLHLETFDVTGPSNVKGVGETPSRRKIFTCRPTVVQEEEACAESILRKIAREAFRQPLEPTDAEYLKRVFRDARETGDFEKGIRTGLQSILADPKFVFRFERAPAGAAPGSIARISDVELASRLSYFLWSSGPDEILLDLASRDALRDPAVLEQQVRRMLADSRSDAIARNFASQWLHLRNLREWQPDPDFFPDADRNLMASMERETELFFMSIIREDRPVLDLLMADYTFVDGRLARHYNIPNIVGNRFRRVKLADESRRGLLGHASILTVTSLSNRTSPVVRGKWILDNLLGAPPPQPPPDVPALRENTPDVVPLPLRARLQRHRENPTCAACHATMDPLGFALESFDAVGVSRTFDSGERIDPSGELVDGTRLDGPVGLRQALLARAHLFKQTFAEKLLTYALSRGIEPHDMPVVRRIVRDAIRDGDRFSAFVLGIVNSPPFRMRQAEETGALHAEHGK